MRHSKLYLILDTQVNDYEEIFKIAQQALKAGVDIVQLRDKFGCDEDFLNCAYRLRKLTHKRIPFIVNDRIDIALAVNADGVHVGQEDIPLKITRRLMGPKKIIGVSCQTYKDALAAQKEGADYIGFGSVFKTLTKPSRQPMNLNILKRVVSDMEIPVFAIGGINLQNIAQLFSIGVKHMAVCRAICLSEEVVSVVKDFKKRF